MLAVDAKGEEGEIEGESRCWFGVNLLVDCLLFLFCELWMEGLVLPSFLNSDNGGTSEVDGGGGCEISDCSVILSNELGFEGPVLPFILISAVVL